MVDKAAKLILVTGANGFVGSYLCEQLQRSGYRVRKVLRGDPRRSSEDVFYIPAFNRFTEWRGAFDGVDAVVHLAALVHETSKPSDIPLYFEVNVDGSCYLAQEALKAGVKRFVFLSSVKVTGEANALDASKRPIAWNEQTPLEPQGAYALSKSKAEELLWALAESQGLELAILRSPLVYGPGVKANFLKLIKAVERGWWLPFGILKGKRSVIYVGNLADAILACLKVDNLSRQIFFVADSKSLAVKDLVKLIAKALNRKARLIPIPERLVRMLAVLLRAESTANRLCSNLIVDTTRITQILKWQPRYTTEQAIEETLKWYQCERNANHQLSRIYEHVGLVTKSLSRSRRDSLSLAFVMPWFGFDIGGGAEAEARALVENIKRFYPKIEITVLTTTLKEFSEDWNKPYHKPGAYVERGIKVHRFSPSIVDREKFHKMNAFRLMPQMTDDLWHEGKMLSPLSVDEEKVYARAMIESPSLERFLALHRFSFDYFFYIPYMFATSFRGSPITRKRSIIIPCLHNERYISIRFYQQMMKSAAAVLFHMEAEKHLANQVYDLKGVRQLVLGEMVETEPIKGNPMRFRNKFNVHEPFLVYAGRKIVGKNVHKLVDVFTQAKQARLIDKTIKLVLLGKGDLDFSNTPDVIDLGFVSTQDKHDAFSAALALCQPSINESFSIVMMEAWLQKVPVLVRTGCAVTKEHIDKSNGGYLYSNLSEFVLAVNTLFLSEHERFKLGQRGSNYVKSNFSPEQVTARLVNFLASMNNHPMRDLKPNRTTVRAFPG